MLLSKYAVCESKKLKFIKEHDTRVLLSKLIGMKVQIQSDLPTANILF